MGSGILSDTTIPPKLSLSLAPFVSSNNQISLTCRPLHSTIVVRLELGFHKKKLKN